MSFFERIRNYFAKLNDPALKRKQLEKRKAKEMAKRLQKNQSSNRD